MRVEFSVGIYWPSDAGFPIPRVGERVYDKEWDGTYTTYVVESVSYFPADSPPNVFIELGEVK